METTKQRGRSGSLSRRRTYSSNKKRTGKFTSRVSNKNRGIRRNGGTKKIAIFNPAQFINTNPVDVTEEIYTPTHNFKTFGLHPRLASVVEKLGITIPSPIQDQIIPEIMKGHDVIGLAETGTGKTAAFLLPILHKTFEKDSRQTLILAPTRELAIQIEDELKKLSRGFRIFSTICVGGMNIRPQIKSLKRKNHFIIGTPGRILDLINRGDFKPETVTTVVLDEADRMLDMGFIHDMKKILSHTPKDRETLFFSATMNKEAEKIVHEFLKDPIRISVKKKEVTDSIEQDIVTHGHSDKFETLVELLNRDQFKRIIIFGAMKHSVQKLSQQLIKNGISSQSIHGNKTHGQRQRSLKEFKDGKVRVLVATDVAARGIHVDDVSHVINYDLPQTFEDYVHRIGRTGRGNKKGKALTFIPESVAKKSGFLK